MSKQVIKDKIYEKIIYFNGTSEESNLHTEITSKCTEGDIESIEYVKGLIKKYLEEEESYTEELMNEIYSNNWGYGIIDKYDAKDVDEIIVLGKRILLKKQGNIIEVPEQFNSYDEVDAVIRRITSYGKIKDLNESNSIASAECADGSRIQVAIPSTARYPVLNKRNFDSFIPTTENMLENLTFTKKEVEIISTLVKGRANILVIGSPESGKTSTVKWLINFMNDKFIIGVLETDFELRPEVFYPNKYFISLREREKYTLADLFAVQLRQSINLIIVTEVRSKEADELIMAMTRGLDGSMGTAHITNADSVPDVLAYMIMENGSNLSFNAKRNQVAEAIDVVIKMDKLPENENGEMKKICGGIYELIAKGENEKHETIALSELIIDEENPHLSNKKLYGDTISDKLKHKLNKNGVKMSEIKRVFPLESR